MLTDEIPKAGEQVAIEAQRLSVFLWVVCLSEEVRNPQTLADAFELFYPELFAVVRHKASGRSVEEDPIAPKHFCDREGSDGTH